MEVWLESLGMHLAVGASVPQDLIVDIYTYTGIRLLCVVFYFADNDKEMGKHMRKTNNKV